MKEYRLPISKLSQEITGLPDRFTEELEATIVTRSGKKVMAILPYYTYQALLETIESLQETLEIMQDEEMMADLRKGLQEIERGETVAWEDVEKELDKLNEMEHSSEQSRKRPLTQHQRQSYQRTNPQAYQGANGGRINYNPFFSTTQTSQPKTPDYNATK